MQIGAPIEPFSNPGIPQEVALDILKHLDLQDLVRMNLVNRSWHQCVQNNPRILQRKVIESILGLAKEALHLLQLEDGKSSSGFILTSIMALLKFESTWDVEIMKKTAIFAKEMALKLNDFIGDALQFQIAVLEIKYDVKTARETAAGLCSQNWRDFVEFRITLEGEKNLVVAKEMALSEEFQIDRDSKLGEIAIVEAKIDLEASKRTLEGIVEDKKRNLAIVEIVKNLAQKDFIQAVELASTISCPYWRSKAQRAIAKIVPDRYSFAHAIESARMITNEYKPDEALGEIIRIQGISDPEGAWENLKFLEGSPYRHRVIFSLQLLKAQSDFHEAQALVNIEKGEGKFCAEVILLMHLYERNIGEAIKRANSYPNLASRFRAFIYLAKKAEDPSYKPYSDLDGV